MNPQWCEWLLLKTLEADLYPAAPEPLEVLEIVGLPKRDIKCTCDIKNLLSVGHDEGCPEKK